LQVKFLFKPLEILSDPLVRAALSEAWQESEPGLTGGHEEGGFIVFGNNDRLSVSRWAKGEGNRIKVPLHPGCMVHGLAIIATFHTHPNTGPDFLQTPSETDKRGVRDDAELKSPLYIGEFVIATEMIYLIMPDGAAQEMGSRAELLG
jgi:hypothetical protein